MATLTRPVWLQPGRRRQAARARLASCPASRLLRVGWKSQRLAPAQQLLKLLRNKSKIEATPLQMASRSTKAFGKGLGLAVLAAALTLEQPRTGFQVASVLLSPNHATWRF
jgi:hypothetical protein